MTLTVHTTNNMADAVDELFTFDDDLEAILDILEEDEAIEEQFSAAVTDVSTISVNFYLFQLSRGEITLHDRKKMATITNTTRL